MFKRGYHTRCMQCSGGKACHMAELLASTGRVDATDIHKHKIGLIKRKYQKVKIKECVHFRP